jgi:gluconokinase
VPGEPSGAAPLDPRCVIGLDIGTTGSRAVAFDAEGRVQAASARTYPLRAPRPAWAEQDPAEIAAAALDSLRECAGALPAGCAVAAIGLSSVMHSLILLDAAGQPLAPMMTWGDVRATPQADEIRSNGLDEELYRRTCCPVHPMYLPAKLRWLRQARPDLIQATRRVASIKEYVARRLTGHSFIDLSVASGSGLLNAAERTWDSLALREAGISADLLGQPVEPSTVGGELLPAVAADTGLPSGTPVVAGAADGPLSSLGCAAIRPGMVTAMIGTSGAVRGVHQGPRTDSQQRTWCYYLAHGRWVTGAAINNGGNVYQWLGEQLGCDAPLDAAALDALAGTVSPGAGGLLCLPFLSGERAPYWNGDARGLYFGLSLAHGRAHLARAMVEGVCFRMRSCRDAVEDVLGRGSRIYATGGVLQSRLWQQTLADCLGRTLVLVNSAEASSLGAALLAMVAIGMARSIDDVGGMVRPRGVVEPLTAHIPTYDALYDLYMRLYWRLQEPFSEVARFQREKQ